MKADISANLFFTICFLTSVSEFALQCSSYLHFDIETVIKMKQATCTSAMCLTSNSLNHN